MHTQFLGRGKFENAFIQLYVCARPNVLANTDPKPETQFGRKSGRLPQTGRPRER